MKVLQVNNVYNAGSTGKIVCDLHDEYCKRGMESIVCYGRGKKHKGDGIYKTCGEIYSKFNNLLSRITGFPYGGCSVSTQKLIRIIKHENPDIVHLHCINGHFVNIYKIVDWLKQNKYKTVITLHAEFMHTANCAHHFDCNKYISGCGHCPRLREATGAWFRDVTNKSWNKLKRAFDGFSNLIIVSVSPWLKEQAIKSPILDKKYHAVVFNGVNTQVFHYMHDNLQTNERPTIFYVTPYFDADPNHIKGGYYVLKLAERMQNVQFLIAGRYDKPINVPNNVTMLGKIADQNLLAQYYSNADLTLLTSKRETFSMVCAESLCCGTPIVGFRAGAPEGIALVEYSDFVSYGDVEALQDSVEAFLSSPKDKRLIADQAAKKYSKERMATEYIDIYQRLMNE